MNPEVELLKNHFMALCNAGVHVKFNGTEYTDSIDVEQAFKDQNITDFSFFLNDRFHEVSYSLGFGYHDSDVFNKIGYPWMSNLRSLLLGFSNEYMKMEDLARLFELQKQSLEVVLTGKKKLEDQFGGSDKWRMYLKDMCEDFRKVINEALRKVEVENMELTFGDTNKARATCKFIFNGKISYAQKKRLTAFLDAKYLPRYQKINGELRSIFRQSGFSSSFNDNGKKCEPCNAFSIEVQSNNWAALGLDETSQFVPRMGMRRSI